MLCPRCSSNQSDDVKYCTFCGANLQAVREVMGLKDDQKSDGAQWWAEMFQSDRVEARKLEMERRFGITP